MSGRAAVLALGLAVALSAVAHAALSDLEVHLAPDAQARHCLKSGRVTATRGDEAVSVPTREGQYVYHLTLSGGPAWEIALAAEGCWSEVLHSAGDEGPLSIAVHRAATASGVFESGTRPGGALRGLVFPLQSGGAARLLGVHGMSTRCALDFPAWQCSVPAGVPLDLRLELPGFGAIHHFDVVAAEDAPAKLPRQRLLAGATVAGWIEDADRVAVPNAKVTLYPMQAPAPTGETKGLAARRHVATANAKGFFQLAGLEPGMYRLVSEANGFSPVNVPEVRVREGESLVWPRPIVQPPVARLEVLLSPPVDPGGSPWVVELEEKAPLHLAAVPPVQGKASAAGRWEAAPLRADTYRLRVRDRNGAPLENVTVDLSEGGLKTIAVDVRTIAIRGVLLVGDEPLSGHLSFTNYSGRDVEARAGEDGVFQAIFPAAGRWVPALEYPRQGDSRIQLAAVDIDPQNAASEPLELRVPGGRIRGVVLGPQKTPARDVVVHLMRGEAGLAANATTGADGRFELVAVAPGSYRVQADGNRMATPRAIPLELDDHETKELTLLLAPKRRLEAIILTPFGTPASGAWVKIAPYGDQGWFTLSADAAGRFGFSVPGGAGDVPLVVTTYAWPSAAALVSTETRAPVTIRLRPDGGVLRVRNAHFPVIRTSGVTAPFGAFKIPAPHGRPEDSALLEPGTYVVCPDENVPAETCRSVTIAPGTQQTLDFATPEKEGES
jgi:hypothetical protein